MENLRTTISGRSISGNDRQPIPALTGLRALAAVWVVLGHYSASLKTLPGVEALAPLLDVGHLGVDVFFVLSGFVLAYNYCEQMGRYRAADHLRFLWLRLARVYPVHIATLAVFVATVLVLSARGVWLDDPNLFTPGALWRNVLLVHAWGFSETTAMWSWNYPSWSVSCEWFMYLWFPLLALVFARLRSGRVAIALVAGLFCVLLAGLLLTSRSHLNALEWQPLIRVGTEFTAGCALYVVFRSGATAAWRWHRIAPIALVALLGGPVLLHMAGLQPLLAAPIGAILVLALANADAGWAGRWLGSRRMVFWGEASYAMYMVHGLQELIIRTVVPPRVLATLPVPARIIAILMMVGIVFAAAAGVYRFVEQPARVAMRRLVTRKRINVAASGA